MTEVLKRAVSFSNNFSTDGPVISVKHYEAKPPANLSSTQIVRFKLDVNSIKKK